MERHHKTTVLSSSSSNLASTAGSSRKSVKRCMWLSTKIPSLFQLAVIVSFVICFLLCLWRLPQDHDAYPDGFNPCPPLSYKILNENNITTRCEPCTECPSGQQLVPPCGTTTQSGISMDCRACPPDTYKEKHGTGRCRPCRPCGLRQTISQCTSERNTQCGECARGYYRDDHTLDSCKRCSTCCGVKRFAELECIYLKQCKRTNCTQQMEDEKSHDIKMDKVSATERITHRRPITHRNASQSDSIEAARNSTLETMISQLKRRFRREDSTTTQSTDTEKYTTKVVEKLATPRYDGSSSRTRAYVDGNGTSLTAFRDKLQEHLDTVRDESVFKPTLPLPLSYNFGSFKRLLTTLVVLASLTFVALIIIAVQIAWKCRQPGHLPGSGCNITCCVSYMYLTNDEYLPVLRDTTPQTEWDSQEISHNGETMVNAYEKRITNGADGGDLESFPLSDISPDLETKLIIKLDVRHNGWKKLGNAFKRDRDELEFLENAFQRPAQSPTKELLEILKTQCVTVGDLISKLESSKVNRPDVASLIRQHVTTTRR